MKAKHTFIIFLAIFAFMATSYGQEAKKTPVNGPEISFDKTTMDFGTLNVGDVKVGVFTITNIGNRPLILDNVVSNCDCTVLDWSRAPIMPGKTAKIKATYTAKTSGLISKWVTVMSNAETDRVILKLRGKVN